MSFQTMGVMEKSRILFFSLLIVLLLLLATTFQQAVSDVHQPLSKVAIHNTVFALDEKAYIKATPNVLGLKVSFEF